MTKQVFTSLMTASKLIFTKGGMGRFPFNAPRLNFFFFFFFFFSLA
jgi:hypothetical protein